MIIVPQYTRKIISKETRGTQYLCGTEFVFLVAPCQYNGEMSLRKTSKNMDFQNRVLELEEKCHRFRGQCGSLTQRNFSVVWLRRVLRPQRFVTGKNAKKKNCDLVIFSLICMELQQKCHESVAICLKENSQWFSHVASCHANAT